MKRILATVAIVGLGFCTGAWANENQTDYLIKFKKNATAFRSMLVNSLPAQARVKSIGLPGWYRVTAPPSQMSSMAINALSNSPEVEYIQPNYKLRMYEQPALAKLRSQVLSHHTFDNVQPAAAKDNPPIPAVKRPTTGSDPLINKQWGMLDIGARSAWSKAVSRRQIVVAVIDTGVDYTHQDLVDNLWRNPGESGRDSNGRDKATNGVDDDHNGYIDDVIGWDFVYNDNKPYDLAKSGQELLEGGNPGHGTHCAGNVAARGGNGKGISGAAPNASIMALRFLGEEGQGSTDGAVAAILYAVKNGANIMSNSWWDPLESTCRHASLSIL